MDNLLQANIFFFIASISVILLTSILIVVLIYIAQILNNFKHLTRRARAEGDLIASDIAELRQEIKRDGFRFKSFFEFFENIFKRTKGRKKKH